MIQEAENYLAKLAKAEKEFIRKHEFETGGSLSDLDLDPEYGSSRGPNHEPGMNIRSQLFALSRDPAKCCIGLLKHLSIDDPLTFSIATALANLHNKTDRPFETHMPVSLYCL